MAQEKTNVMRLLSQAKIAYTPHFYDHKDGAIDGIAVAEKLGQSVEQVFKTLVTRGSGRSCYVFVIPVAEELNLKAAAKACGEKSVEMIHVKEINTLTGYIRGGCSPIGMKKLYPTFVDESARNQQTIMVSAGKIGTQVELAPQDLVCYIGAQFAPLTQKP